MSDDAEARLVAYFAAREARRKRAWRIVAVVVTLAALIGGGSWVAYASGAKQRHYDERQVELNEALRCNLRAECG